jgi:hypothetical protein
MQTKTIGIAGIAGVLAILALVVAYPALAAAATGTAQSQMQTGTANQLPSSQGKISFTMGQKVTFTSIKGGYLVIGNRDINGTASGSLTIQVTGVLKGGCMVAVTSGTINIAGTSYTISGGSAEIGPYGKNVVGQGASGNPAFFLFHERSLGSFGGTAYGVLTFDLKTGSTEYGVRLLVNSATA